MAFWLDRRRVLFVAGGVLTLGLGYLFVQHVFFTLSITVRAVLILGFALVCLCWTAAPGRQRELPAFAAVASLIAVLFYSLIQFRVSPAVIALLVPGTLVGVSAILYYVQNGRLALSGSMAAYATLGIVLLSGAFVGVDLQAGDVEYTATLNDSVTLGNDSRNVTTVQIGSAAATNTFLFREPVDFPNTQACIYTGENRSDLGVFYNRNGETFHVSVAPGGQLETRMNLRVRPETATATAGPIPIERADTCPPAGDGPPRVVVASPPPTPANATG